MTTIYKENFGEGLHGRGELVVLKRATGVHSIFAYLPAGMNVNDMPEVLVNGTLEECRAKWTWAKTWIKKQLGVKTLADHSPMTGYDFDVCPNHGKDSVKEYDFGMNDARVTTFACGCAACQIGDSLDDCGTYHTSYAGAAGRARLGVAINAVKFA